jgi:hypothetical protein
VSSSIDIVCDSAEKVLSKLNALSKVKVCRGSVTFAEDESSARTWI